jgi:hypothetical protein
MNDLFSPTSLERLFDPETTNQNKIFTDKDNTWTKNQLLDLMAEIQNDQPSQPVSYPSDIDFLDDSHDSIDVFQNADNLELPLISPAAEGNSLISDHPSGLNAAPPHFIDQEHCIQRNTADLADSAFLYMDEKYVQNKIFSGENSIGNRFQVDETHSRPALIARAGQLLLKDQNMSNIPPNMTAPAQSVNLSKNNLTYLHGLPKNVQYLKIPSNKYINLNKLGECN